MRKLRSHFTGFLLLLSSLLTLTSCGQRSDIRLVGEVREIGSVGYYGQATWSPDGKLIAVIHQDIKGYSRLEIVDANGQLVESVIQSEIVENPGWIEGRVAFLEWSLKGTARLQVVAPGGFETVAKVTNASFASWSRDGNSVVLNRVTPASAGSTLWFLDLKTGHMKEIWSGETAQRIRLSPNGGFFAFTNIRSSAVSVMDIRTGEVAELWRVPSPGEALAGLTWSPDEAFLGVRRGGNAKSSGFYVLDRKGKEPPKLLTTVDMVDPDWHPSGNRIVYTTVGAPGSNKLRVLELPDLKNSSQ